MSAILKCSPAKQKRNRSEEEGFSTAGKSTRNNRNIHPTWKCPSVACGGRLIKLKKGNNSYWAVCENNIKDDDTTCQLTFNIFSANASGKFIKYCEVCTDNLGGVPSIGIATGELLEDGSPEWENVHANLEHCVLKRVGSSLAKSTEVTASYPEDKQFSTLLADSSSM